ncbi:MAG: bacillithiol biosynthesis deacetylase BshB1 [Gemmatimonadetes bacterium]|nr:bacillithiol biosynthesis deacetylase BshB1 [Gemmatimonadota bacterium]
MVDVLAIFAHPDDAEFMCGGTLIRARDFGHATGILDLTAGELGTRGTAEIRAREAQAAARVLGLSVRVNLALPDARLENSLEARTRLVEAIRRLRPRVVVLPYPGGRHPDHRVAGQLGYDACYLAGLKKFPTQGDPHRPRKVLYAIAYSQQTRKPTFVVDTTEAFERKLEALRCYRSQFEGVQGLGELLPAGVPLPELVKIHDARYGSLIRRPYGEPFYTRETMRVEDVAALDVQSI